MNCPMCGENFKIFEAFKFWLNINMPRPLYRWREQRLINTKLEKIKKLYSVSANLNPREHFVCSNRVYGLSTDEVAKLMNVTNERIRQIEAKALRKLERAKC